MGHLPLATRLTDRAHPMLSSPILQQNRPLITFVASAEPSGDGVNPETMDYFMGNQYPWVSLLVPEFQCRGCSVEVLNWQSPVVDWGSRDCLFVGPVWGYSKAQVDFDVWLEEMKRLKIPLINSMDFIRWNFKKTYLVELQNAGLTVRCCWRRWI